MPGGRPTLLTLEITDAICDLIRQGNYREVAAHAYGIGKRTLRTWLARGRNEPGTIFEGFRHAVLRAEQEAEIEQVRLLLATHEPRYCLEWLSRKFPQRWGKDTDAIRQLRKQIADLERLVFASVGANATAAHQHDAQVAGVAESTGDGEISE